MHANLKKKTELIIIADSYSSYDENFVVVNIN